MKNLAKLKIILISLLMGIVILQGLWIYDAFTNRQSTLEIHIQNAVVHSLNHYCNDKIYLRSNPEKELKLQIKTELDYVNEYLDFEIEIISNSESIINNKNSIMFEIECEQCKQSQFLKITLKAEDRYILSSIITWIGLSFLFISLLSIFTTLYIRSLNIQKQMQKLKDEFISSMTHELKTPISTISVASEILKNKKVDLDKDKVIRYSEIIFEENNRLKMLVDRVLQVSLFESGKMKFDLQEHNLHDVIESALVPLSLIINKRKGILEEELKATAPIILLDKTHFINMISNLIENSIKYSNERPHIKVSSIDYQTSIKIIIEDHGIGISKENLNHIFDKYYRGNIKNKLQSAGFGLGLFYVKQVTKGHQATISAESTESVGTKFILTFPRIY